MWTQESTYSGKTIARFANKNEGSNIIMLKKKKQKKVDISISSTVEKENLKKLCTKLTDVPTSTKEIKRILTLGPLMIKQDILEQKIKQSIIHKNLSRHQNWMFKQCAEYVIKNIESKECLIWKDSTDNFIRFCNSIKPTPISIETAKRKFRMIAKFYQKQPEIHPNYCKTDESSFLMKNLTEKNQQFLMQRKLIGSMKENGNGESNSNDVTVKITSKVFTESFYNSVNLKSPKLHISYSNTEKSTSSETPFSNKKRHSRRSSKADNQRSSLLNLLQNESLISKTNEELVIDGKIEVSNNSSENTGVCACSETQKIKNMKLMLKYTISNNSTIRNQSVDGSDNKKVSLNNQSKQNSTIMDLINKVRNQHSFNKTLEGSMNDSKPLMKTLKSKPRISLKRFNSNNIQNKLNFINLDKTEYSSFNFLYCQTLTWLVVDVTKINRNIIKSIFFSHLR